MSSEHNLTPDQRKIPPAIRTIAYQQVPKTCDTVRAILDEAGKEIAKVFGIKPEDQPAIDAIISMAFLAIRDRVTQPLRTAQMKALHDWQKTASFVSRAQSGDAADEHPFEGDLYQYLGTEFGKARKTVKANLFVTLFGMAYATGTPEGQRPLLDRCRDHLTKVMKWIPLTQAQKIRFVRTVSALVRRRRAHILDRHHTFETVEEEEFEAGDTYEVTSVTPQAAPNTDMAYVVFKDGRSAPLMMEDFEVVGEAPASQC